MNKIKTFIQKEFSEYKELNTFRKGAIIVSIVVSLIVLVISIANIITLNTEYSRPIKSIFIILTSIFIILLSYLVLFDIKFFEIPEKLTNGLLVGSLAINLILIPLIGLQGQIIFWNGNTTTPLLNLVGGIAGGLVILAVVLLTKGNGMGGGDIRVIAILGFLIGVNKLIIGFYITIFSALFIGLAYSAAIKKLKGVQIPFVPFLVFGSLVAFLTAWEIGDLMGLIRFGM